MTLTLLPSPAKAAVAWASAQSDLAALHGGRVGTKLNATLPALRVTVISGNAPDPWEGLPVLQWEAWGVTEGAADTLIRTLVAALPQFRGTYDNGHVYTYNIESGPYYAPDDPQLSTNARYILTTRLLTTP